MAKQDVIAAQIIAIKEQAMVQALALITEVLGAAYDSGAQDQAALDGAGTSVADQAKIDALTAQVVDLQSKLDAAVAQDKTDIKAGQEAMALVQAQLLEVQIKLGEALKAKSADEDVIRGLQASAGQLETLLGQLKAIVLPA